MAAPRTLTQTFDHIAEGAFITMPNPVWMTAAEAAFPTFEGDKDIRARKAAEWLANLVTDWAVPVLDEDDEAQLLTDRTSEVGLKCPAPMERWIVKTLVEGAAPP